VASAAVTIVIRGTVEHGEKVRRRHDADLRTDRLDLDPVRQQAETPLPSS
jgi:hypothetical protein